MGIIDRLEQRGEIRTLGPSPALTEWLGGWRTSSGMKVSHQRSLELPIVWACVKVIAETVGSLPLITYERLEPRGRSRAYDHELYHLLHRQPNPAMTASVFFELVAVHLALWGNFFAEVERRRGRVVALWPLPAGRVYAEVENGKKVIVAKTERGVEERIPSDRVLHVIGMSLNGVNGLSPIALHRQSVGLGLGAQEYGARFFGNGARPGGVLTHPSVISTEALQRLRTSWDAFYGGAENAHRVALLEEGMKFESVSLPPGDAQYIESADLTAKDIARIFRVPQHKVGIMDNAIKANVEAEGLNFWVDTIRPWVVRIEQAINASLVSPSDQPRIFSEFLVDALVRADIKSRYEAYAVGRQWGWLSPNDILEMENRNPIPDGDEYLRPLNMVPAGTPIEGLADEGRSRPERREECSCGVTGCAEVRDHEPEETAENDRERRVRAATNRHRIQQSYVGLLTEGYGRVVMREAKAVSRQARKMLPGDPDGFRRWLTRFYDDTPAFVERVLGPILDTYLQLIAGEAAKEVGGTEPEAFEELRREYIQAMAERHARIQRGQLEARYDRTEPTEWTFETDEQLRDWGINPETLESEDELFLAGRIGRREATYANGYMSRYTFQWNGVSYLVWTAVGVNCPLCNAIDGERVGIAANFVELGEGVLGAPANLTFSASQSVGHPPLHRGCDCIIVPD